MKQRLLLFLLFVPCLAAGLFAAVRLAWLILFCPASGHRLAVAFDQLVNAATGGDEDETISSRAAKAARRQRRWGCLLCWLLSLVDPGHCERSIEPDRGDPLPPPPVLYKPRKRFFHFWSF
ncbi:MULTISPECIES: hypothetical protein [Pseudomonas]|uniref:hypothetical protein n=1 Tax=Pseudomonas TaxID=286 RepID=UPI001F348CBF|nr:hypothetical protein [Pseudomonas gessardii]